jgi:glutathione S-transferase
MAILVYLARRYGNGNWLPTDVVGEAQVMQWLAVSENELLYGLARARATLLLKRPFNLEQCQTEGKAGLAVMEQQLAGNEWLVAGQPTIADIACYPYVLLAPMGEISLEDYPHVRQWLARVEALSGWVAMTS